MVRLKGATSSSSAVAARSWRRWSAAASVFRVVPGITAASGCAAYAGIPLTHRDHAQSVRFVTAHGKGAPGSRLAAAGQRSANAGLLYGASSCATIREQLLAHGKAGDTPVALIEAAPSPASGSFAAPSISCPRWRWVEPGPDHGGICGDPGDQLPGSGQGMRRRRGPWPRPDRCILFQRHPRVAFLFCIYCHNLLF